MNGDGERAGLRQMIAERREAELGATGLGRLVASDTGTAVTLSEDAAALPFGFKVTAASASGTAMSAAVALGPPADATISLAGLPANGDSISITLTDSDNVSHVVTLKASTTPPQPGATGTFQIGGTVAETTASIRTALAAAVGEKAAEVLGALAATDTAEAFFAGSQSNPPQRVAGPPFASATGFVAGTEDNTVVWYNGDDDATTAARATAPVAVNQSQVVGAGARANEPAIRNLLAQLAVLSAESFEATPVDAARYEALTERVFDRLTDEPGNPQVSDIAHELSMAAGTMKTAKERHQSTKELMLDVIEGVEKVDEEETAAAMLTLQTRLQASYEATSILSRLTLVNYL
jgi:hypothetical protein